MYELFKIKFFLFFFLIFRQFFENQYNLVKNWTKNIDIFKFDYLVIPIFRDKHWSLALICFPGKVIENNAKDNAQDHNKENDCNR